MLKIRNFIHILSATSVLLVVQNGFATENGGGVYPNGIENYMMGAVPPPGFHTLVYAANYSANRLNDNNGNKAVPDFSLDVAALALRFVEVVNIKLLGGQMVFHEILPFMYENAKIMGKSQNKTNIAGVTVGIGLAYHLSENLHYVYGIDVNAPIGPYNKNDLVNISRNYWNIEPLYAITYVQPSGINADIKAMYDYNFKNSTTEYTSGQELHADYSIGWGFGKNWVAGIGGYIYQQITNDQNNGVDVDNNKGRAFAAGPSFKYDNGKGFLITFKWQYEFSVVNRPQGDAFWLKCVIPLH